MLGFACRWSSLTQDFAFSKEPCGAGQQVAGRQVGVASEGCPPLQAAQHRSTHRFRHIVDDCAGLSVPVVHRRKTVEALLPRSVPDLKLDNLVLQPALLLRFAWGSVG